MLNFAIITRMGTSFETWVITDIINSRLDSMHTTYEVMNPFLMFSNLTMKYAEPPAIDSAKEFTI